MSVVTTQSDIRALTRRAEILPLLERDRVWAAYALGDLEEGLFERCEWYAVDDALALLFKGPQFTPLFTMGSAESIEAILATCIKPPQIHLSQRREHLPAVEKFYQCDQPHWMWLMALNDFKPVDGDSVQLGMERFAELRALYAESAAGSIFASYQLATGYFYGVEADGRLVSVAGVQLASRQYRVGPIGNVATHPSYRGRGYAAIATSAVVRALRRDGITTIVLTVAQTNTTAIRVYERLGFVKYGEFMAGNASRKYQR